MVARTNFHQNGRETINRGFVVVDIAPRRKCSPVECVLEENRRNSVAVLDISNWEATSGSLLANKDFYH